MEIISKSTLPAVEASVGPLARTVDDCAIFLEAILNEKYYKDISLAE